MLKILKNIFFPDPPPIPTPLQLAMNELDKTRRELLEAHSNRESWEHRVMELAVREDRLVQYLNNLPPFTGS